MRSSGGPTGPSGRPSQLSMVVHAAGPFLCQSPRGSPERLAADTWRPEREKRGPGRANSRRGAGRAPPGFVAAPRAKLGRRLEGLRGRHRRCLWRSRWIQTCGRAPTRRSAASTGNRGRWRGGWSTATKGPGGQPDSRSSLTRLPVEMNRSGPPARKRIERVLSLHSHQLLDHGGSARGDPGQKRLAGQCGPIELTPTEDLGLDGGLTAYD